MTTTHTQPAGCDLDSLELDAIKEAAKFAWAYGKEELHATLEKIVARAAQAPQGDTRQGAPAGTWYAQEFLNWNRAQKSPPVAIGKELGVARKVMEFAAHTCTPADERALWKEYDEAIQSPMVSNAIDAKIKALRARLIETIARAAQGAGTAPVAASQTIDVCTPCQGTGLVQHYLGGKTVCLDCATHPAPVSTAASPEKTILHLRWRQEHAEWRECMSDCLGAVEFVGVVPAGYVGVAPAATVSTAAAPTCKPAQAAPEAPATEQQGDLVGNLKLALQRVKSSSLLVEARQFADVGLALIDVQGKATHAATTASASLDHADLAKTAKEALRDLSHIENHLEHSDAPTTIKNRAVDVRLCIKELQAALKAVATTSRAADGQQGASRAGDQK